MDCVISEAARPCLILGLCECEELEECEVVVALALVGILFEGSGAIFVINLSAHPPLTIQRNVQAAIM